MPINRHDYENHQSISITRVVQVQLPLSNALIFFSVVTREASTSSHDSKRMFSTPGFPQELF